jgi:hypothetical protein
VPGKQDLSGRHAAGIDLALAGIVVAFGNFADHLT